MMYLSVCSVVWLRMTLSSVRGQSTFTPNITLPLLLLLLLLLLTGNVYTIISLIYSSLTLSKQGS